MDVFIVSKTKMKNLVCVGAVSQDGRYVRMLTENGRNQDKDTQFDIGDVWAIEHKERENIIPPHIEDVLVGNMTYKFTTPTIEKMVLFLEKRLKIKIINGGLSQLYDGLLRWTNGGSGYISKRVGVPSNSVGFWVLDKDLTRTEFKGKIKYEYPNSLGYKRITYVGTQESIDVIPEGTLVRVSLARWWSPQNSNIEERCYLQLSGWY